MTRTRSFLPILVLLAACTSEPSRGGTTAKVDTPSTTKPSETPPADSTLPANPAPPADPADAERLHVTAEQAKSFGLPPLSFSLKLGDSGLSGGGGNDGDYLTLSSPPGGTLMLRAYPATVGGDLKALVGKRHPEQTELSDDKIELLSVGRPALTWVRGESLGRSSYCAFIVGPPGVGVGGPALLLELEIGANDAGCTASRDALAPVLESLRFD